MKKRLLCAAAAAALFFGALTVLLIMAERDASKIRGGVLRLHIVAASDSEIDQQNKLSVRDGVASLCSELFGNAADKAEAMACAEQNGGVIEKAAESILSARGSDDDVHLVVRKRFFPTRRYEGVSLPAGVYDTVDIEIGEHEGKNFWCVMFPDICIGASDAKQNREKMSDVLSGSPLEMATNSEKGTVKFKFALVELFESILRACRGKD